MSEHSEVSDDRAQFLVAARRDDLARGEARDLLVQACRAERLGDEELAGRNIERREAKLFSPRATGDQEAFFRRGQHHLLADGAGRDDAHDLARHQPFRIRLDRACSQMATL